MKAIGQGNIALVRDMLRHGVDVDAQDEHGCTALLVAVRNRNERLVRVLLQDHANVNVCANDGSTALWTAVRQHSATIARNLLQQGADLDKKNKGWTVLVFAARTLDESMVKTLLNSRAKSAWQVGELTLALTLACQPQCYGQLAHKSGKPFTPEETQQFYEKRWIKEQAIAHLLVKAGAQAAPGMINK